jgi:hypothetical protein
VRIPDGAPTAAADTSPDGRSVLGPRVGTLRPDLLTPALNHEDSAIHDGAECMSVHAVAGLIKFFRQ